MSLLRPVSIGTNSVTQWGNTVVKSINQNNIYAGDNNIKIVKTSTGTSISLTPQYNAERLIWKGDFDIDAEYFPNDVVRVNPDNTYFNSGSMQNLQMDSTNITGYDECPITPGLYVCMQYVPPAYSDETLLNTLLPQYGGTIPYDIAYTFRLYDYNIYYPIYPEISSSATSSVATSFGFNIIANTNYWQALTPSIKMNACVAGTNTTMFIGGFLSGSSFASEYLPYQV